MTEYNLNENKPIGFKKQSLMSRLNISRDVNPFWLLPIFLMVIALMAPIFNIFAIAFFPEENIWPHLFDTVLFDYISETLILSLGVSIICLLVGVSTAWLVTMYEFPGRKWFSGLLLLPLAMPSYIIAYTYVEIFDYSNVIQTTIRDVGGFTSARDYYFPEIRSMWGAIFVLSFALYPYVYLSARSAFLQQSICLLEAGRMLGHSRKSIFFKIALPLARPAIFVGLSLALMETLNDVGAVEFFGVNTLTFGIYSTWLERGNLGGGAQIALVLLFFVFCLILFEKWMRKGSKYEHTTRQIRPIARTRLAVNWQIFFMIICTLPILLGFLFPISQLVHDSFEFVSETDFSAFFEYAKNSLMLSSITAFFAVILALLISYSDRIFNIKLIGWVAKFVSVGYAIPGAILGLGIFIFLINLDTWITPFMLAIGVIEDQSETILSGTIFAIIFAYLIRFLAVSNGAIETGFGKIPINYDHAARSLGHQKLYILWKIQIPLIRPAIAMALILTFIDSMKELPATLILRPFNFNTLATHVYDHASLEIFEQAAIPALSICVIGLIPVYLLNRLLNVPSWRDGQTQSV